MRALGAMPMRTLGAMFLVFLVFCLVLMLFGVGGGMGEAEVLL